MNAFDTLVELLEATTRDPNGKPVFAGVGGGVAAGKSTLAAALAEALTARGVGAAVLCTDCFLLPNAELDARGLSARKGFPESFDHDAIAACLAALRRGPVDVPVYSHVTYDIAPGERRRIEAAAVVIVEGVNVFWPPVVDQLDTGVYIDAHDDDLRTWYLDRFTALCAAAEGDPSSFYRALTPLAPAARRDLGEAVWSAVNLVNLRDHIAPSRARAASVLRKTSGHDYAELTVRRRSPHRAPGP